MLKSLSFDLRSRVLAAIDQGLSRRQAAKRFGVSAASAIRWHAARAAGGLSQSLKMAVREVGRGCLSRRLYKGSPA